MMKVKPVKLGKTERMSFSHIDEVISMPNLIEVQKNSYQWFLDEGLKEVFHDIGTIEDYTGNLALSFVDFRLDKEPKYSIKECKERDVTYAAPLRVTARLLNKETGEVKDQEIFMGDFPLMTDAGTFVINGAERAIVSQLVRSPGVFYGDAKDKVGNDLYSATMNPNRGAWLEYETDASNVFYVRIDKNRKLPVTVLCRALGLSSDEEILNFFGEDERILATLEKDTTKNQDEGLLEVYRKLRPGEPPTVESATNQINMLFFDPRRYDLSRFGRYKMNKKLSLARRITGFVAAENIVAPLTGEIIVEAKGKITRELAEKADAAGVDTVVLSIEGKKVKVITNGCVDAQGFFSFDVKECGINERCSFDEIKKILDTTSDVEEQKEMLRRNHDQLIGRTVTVKDILSSINYLNGLGHGVGTTDDIDHLGNRRIRSVGELLQNQFRIGFSRMERVIRERMTLQSQDQSVITPQALINIRPVVAAIKEFFGSSPLSQFMDQNNPLAELTHKRRLSALGPGGLSRDRAGFEVRDVHYSHYGRMCPIETPEGPNIGLISYLASYAKINEYGFVEAPYRKVKKTYDENGRLLMPPKPPKATEPPAINSALAVKAVRYRVWHTKEAEAAYISQLELQSLLERAMRRAGLPMAFSQGFHPLPLISFGRALPVGVESQAEWFSIVLREPLSAEEVMKRLAPRMLRGLRLDRLEEIPVNDKSVGSVQETFSLRFVGSDADRRLFMEAWDDFTATDSLMFTRETKKGPRTADIRPLFQVIEWDEHGTLYIVTDWSETYISPMTLARAITPWAEQHQLKIMKLSQMFG